MKRPPPDWRLYALSTCFAALPFAFALFRAVETGDDFRYLWGALACLCGATAIMAVAGRTRLGSMAAVAVSAGVFIIATLFAVLAALLLGTTLGLGILVVASAFGFCFAVGSLLYILAGPEVPG